jgi:TonB family protein
MPSTFDGPEYPRAALFARLSGTVVIRLNIDNKGAVGAVKILSGHPVLARSVIEQVQKWRFSCQQGNNLENSVHHEMQWVFLLSGNCNSHQHCRTLLRFEMPDRVLITSELPKINPVASRDDH